MTKQEFDRRVDAHWRAIVERAEREYAAQQPEPEITLDVSVPPSPAEQLWRSLDPEHGRNPNLGANQPGGTPPPSYPFCRRDAARKD